MADHGGQVGRLALDEVVRPEPVEHAAQLLVLVVVFPGIVAGLAQGGDLLNGVAEDEDVVGADLLKNLDVRAVEGADGEGTVEGELHVARARGLLASGGDLFGEIGSGNDAGGERHAVVRQEGDLQAVLDAGIRVDAGAHGVDRLDDGLGEVIARGGLGGEDEDTRDDVEVRVLDQAAVEGEDMQQVEVLALVLVQALDLDVEEGVGRNQDPALALDLRGEEHLVLPLDRHELRLEGRLIGPFLELAELVEVAHPAVANLARDEGGEAEIAGAEPAARRDAVGHVDETAGEQRVEFREEVGAEQARVQLGHAVDSVGAHDGQVGHADQLGAALFNEGDRALLGIVARPLGLAQRHQVLVDVVDDEQVAGQHALEERHAPLLERLGEQRMVGVGEDVRGDFPGGGEIHPVLVDEDAHQLGDGDGRVRVVELDGLLLGEVVPVVAGRGEMATDDVAQRAGDEEVLLDEAELLAVFGAVVRVEHLGDGLAVGLLAHGLDVAAVVEGAQVEVLGGLGGPETEDVHRGGAVADDRDVVREADDGFRVDPVPLEVAAVVKHLLAAAEEFHFLLPVRAHDFPRGAVNDPVVRMLDLVAVDELLAEKAELVMDAVADRGKIQGGERVEVAGGEAAETAVAETHVLLRTADLLEVQAKLVQGIDCRFVQTEADEIVREQPAHQVLERQVVDSAGVLLAVRAHRIEHALEDAVAHGDGGGDPPVTVGRVALVPGQAALQLMLDGSLHLGSFRTERALGGTGRGFGLLGLRGHGKTE